MTVSSVTTVHHYVGDGVQKEWPVQFPFFSPQDVKAIRTSVAGTDTVMVYGSEYSVRSLGEGGVCSCTVGAGEQLTLFLDIELVQQIALSNTGVLAPEILEQGLDRLTLISQQLQEGLSRCVQIGRTSGMAPTSLLASIEASALRCAQARETAIAGADSAAYSAVIAEAAREAAQAAAMAVELPVPASTDAGCGLVAAPSGGWTLGGTAAGKNVGTGDDEVPINSMVQKPKWYMPQTLVSAPADFIAASITTTDAELVDVLTSANQNGYVVKAIGGYSAGYDPYKVFNHLNSSAQSYAGGYASGNGFSIELPNVMYFAKYSLANYRASVMGYTVYASLDGSTWTQVDIQVAKSIGTSATVFTLAAPMQCKFIKFTNQTQDNDYFYVSDFRPLGDRTPAPEDTSYVTVDGPLVMALAASGGAVEMLTKLGSVNVPLEAVEGVLVDGTQYIVATKDSIQAVATIIPTYDVVSGEWGDGIPRHILGWALVSSGNITGTYACHPGTYAEITPSGTTLPNPFVHLPIAAIQDGNVRAVVNNQITGISTTGGTVRVWRVA